MHKTIMKNVFVSEINASEYLTLNCLDYEENTCHRQSVC